MKTEILFENKEIVIKKCIYTLCFFMFCVINQRIETCSPLNGGREVFRNLTGSVIAVLIISHYGIKDISHQKIAYLVWGLVGIVISVIFYMTGKNIVYFGIARLVAALNLYIFGFILIRTYITVFVEKEYPKLNWRFFSVWFAMMMLMILSRSTYIWPFVYLVMFGCFYLTDYTLEEQENLVYGAINGIILSFFVFQAWCCVFRPYDVLRYKGIFSNSNHAALYYLFVLVAVFSKYIYLVKKGCSKVLKLFFWLGIGMLYAFLFMTIGRTAWILGFILGVYFLWALKRIQQKKNFFKNSLAMILSFCLMFPVVFGIVRYIPPLFHHPVWFFGEWNEERVHAWDKWDSEKYVDFEDFWELSVNRIFVTIQNIIENSSFMVVSKAAELEEETPEEKYNDMLEQGYALTWDKYEDPLAERGAIYRYYIEHLNLFGHPYEEQGFQLYSNYWVGHAHNIFLQYGTDFGIIVMVLFIVLTIDAMISLGKGFHKTGSERIFAEFLFMSVTILFGLLEYAWGVGSLSIMMMFIVWREVCVAGNEITITDNCAGGKRDAS